MGIVFAALILIWWMMALLTKVTAEKQLAKSEPRLVSDVQDEEKAQAAAIAVAIAMAEPRGPVYLSLPREPLAAPLEGFELAQTPRQVAPAPPAPAPAAIDQAAAILADAARPLIISARAGRAAGGAEALARFADRFAMPVVEFWPPQNSLPTTHPMHGGFDVAPWLAEADAVLVIDSLVPWLPSRHALPPGCPVVQIGPDPSFSALPMRGFPSTVAIQSDAAAALDALHAALSQRLKGKQAA